MGMNIILLVSVKQSAAVSIMAIDTLSDLKVQMITNKQIPARIQQMQYAASSQLVVVLTPEARIKFYCSRYAKIPKVTNEAKIKKTVSHDIIHALQSINLRQQKERMNENAMQIPITHRDQYISSRKPPIADESNADLSSAY